MFTKIKCFRCVLTPGDPYMSLTNDKIIERVSKQVLALFPSSQGLEVIWSSVVKIAQSLYREGPGKDPFRPDQKTPVKNFFLAGSYTKQAAECARACVYTSLLLFRIRKICANHRHFAERIVQEGFCFFPPWSRVRGRTRRLKRGFKPSVEDFYGGVRGCCHA
uniref:Amine oxidase domain-containing protein n=1 Tax=Salix viminalis TaxID=40686 RepID=A0A6N2L1U2_SALVM